MMGHLRLPLFLLLLISFISATIADDGAVILKLAQSLHPAPSGWSAKSSVGYCRWNGLECDSSNRVTSIELKSLSLFGNLPSEISSLSQLRVLSLQRNFISGAIPSFAKHTSLQEINLDSNNFTSISNGAFSGLTNLQVLSMSSNKQLTPWHFPYDLTESTSLGTLSLDATNLMGSLPDVFESLPSLQNVRLSYNNFSGSLPPSLGKSGIQNLMINNQQLGFSGTLEVLSGMTQLNQAWMHQNQFTGPIPDLSKCANLFDLQLRDNLLTGIVPETLLTLTSLQNVSLDSNKLQGPTPSFPKTIGKATITDNNFCLSQRDQPCDPQVTELLEIAADLEYPLSLSESWIGNNPCSGWRYVSCDSTGKIVTLNFQKQGFVGKISPSIAELKSLKNLYLNDNKLTGPIPPALTEMSTLQNIDVSNNNLTGDIPKFPASVKFIYKGNPLLGTTTGVLGTLGGGKSSVAIGIVISLLIILLIVAFVLYKLSLKKGRRNYETKSQMGELALVKNMSFSSNDDGFMNGYTGLANEIQIQGTDNNNNNNGSIFDGGNDIISIHVLRQVTDNFSEANILGRGGFGVVYKGELHDGTKIAVKRMESSIMGTKGMNEFQAEIAVLSKVRHRHLVALLGNCVNGNERLLVYEHMPQGTLAQHLFECRELGYTPLTWKQRVTTALDVARGVEYLHGLAQQSFIHRDLKPSNILLDDDMRAKVADFGLVKNAPDGNYSVETRLAGTFGYLAPEYAATGRVTTKVDVFAFGVVLMEILTGRKALDDSLPDEESHLVTWFRRVLNNKDNIAKAIDETIELDEETMASVYKVAELAGHCTAREPHQRPDMGHAVNVLSPLVETWRPAATPNEEENNGIDLHMTLPQALQRWQTNEDNSITYQSDMSYS